MEGSDETGEVGPTLLTNLGAIWSGRIDAPVVDADSVRIQNGKIQQIGVSLEPDGSEVVYDAGGMTLAPGLIDSHSHVFFDDYSPRQKTLGFLERYVHGAVTQVISAGEIHLPNRPGDAEGVKALAVLAQRSWSGFRPGGMKVHAGVIIIEPTLDDEDFDWLAKQGVALAKVGFGRFARMGDARPQVKAAQAAGMVVTAHCGGPTAHDGSVVSPDALLELEPDVFGHVNGGPTSLDDSRIAEIISQTGGALQLVQAGNLRSAIHIADSALESDAEGRIVLGTDSPTGTGVMPLGMLKTVAELSSLGGFDPRRVWAWGTGNTALRWGLDSGRIEAGRPADLVIIDSPLGGVAGDAAGSLARGDLPTVSAVFVDGRLQVDPSRMSPRQRKHLVEVARP